MNRTSRPTVGLVEWFRPGEYERVEKVLAETRLLGIRELRTSICWADWYASEGDGWYAWLLPRLSREVKVLPCFRYTPPSIGIVPKFSSPPQRPKAYADFIDVMMSRFGEHFDWIELWNRPDSASEWDQKMDPDWSIFSEMIGGAAHWIQKRGKKTVLPAVWPTDLKWLSLMHKRGVLNYINAVGIHGFPSTTEVFWGGWDREVEHVRDALKSLDVSAEVWITQTGFSTWRGDERAQVSAFADVLKAAVQRVYWQELFDRTPTTEARVSVQSDERDYHYGLKRADTSPKLLFRIWEEAGLEGVRSMTRDIPAARNSFGSEYALITGGAGFVGTNLAHSLLRAGHPVMIFDNLARAGVERNLDWIQENHKKNLRIEIGDVRDAEAVKKAVGAADQVFHFAAQVAVTSSLIDPRLDHDVNVGGTLNVLEAIRQMDDPASLVFASTNKVYGALSHIRLQRNCKRYQPMEASLRNGVSEDRPLEFHSPYGCSKGAADQYVLDYARTFGIPAIVFRMSCIYGPHQMGTEDQGWVAHFLIRALERKTVQVFGDGMQVRDLLFIEDLVDAFLLAQANSQTLSGHAFNIGGGLGNTVSLLEVLELIEELHGEAPAITLDDWRVGDQRYYVSDTSKFKAATGWTPEVSVRKGMEHLYEWLIETFEENAVPVEARAHALLAH